MALSRRRIGFNTIRKFEYLAGNSRFLTQLNTKDNEEYTKKPEYPPILYRGQTPTIEYKQKVRNDAIRALPTVEQKLFKMCKYEKCYMMQLSHHSSDPLPFIQYNTRTHIVNQLPKVYNDVDVENIYEMLKPHLVKAIISEYKVFKSNCSHLSEKEQSQELARGIMRHISRLMINSLANDYEHLFDAQVDTDARVEAFWHSKVKGKAFLGVGLHSTDEKKYNRKPLEDAVETMQYADKSFIQIRSQLPLPQFVDINDDLCTKSEIPFENYHPTTFGYKYTKRYATLVSGVWHTDPCKFGSLSMYSRENLILYNKVFGAENTSDRLISNGILASFSWLMSLASLRGFTPVNDVTYPTTTQTVMSDGQHWSFFTYQLNTVITDYENPLRNICWHSSDLKLYDEITDSEIIGLNDEVLKTLMKFYMNKPEERNIDLTPYLGEDNMTDDERDNVKYFWPRFYSNRPVYRKEKPLWQHIYRDNIERIPQKK